MPNKPSAQGDEPIKLVVTDEKYGYRVPDAFTATKTDTPIRDIPGSIQVIPQQVLKDQGALRVQDLSSNVSGVTTVLRTQQKLSLIFLILSISFPFLQSKLHLQASKT